MPHSDPETRRQYESARYQRRKREGTLPVRSRAPLGRATVPPERQKSRTVSVRLTQHDYDALAATVEAINYGGKFRQHGIERTGLVGNRLTLSSVFLEALDDWMARHAPG